MPGGALVHHSFITRVDGTGTLLVQRDKHSAGCSQNVQICIVDKRAYDGILDYFGHSEEELCSVQNISDLSNADGDLIFAIDSDVFPENAKPPGRKWKHACTYRTTSCAWNTQQRRCTDCPAILRYIRSKFTNKVIIQHIGTHICQYGPTSEKNKKIEATSIPVDCERLTIPSTTETSLIDLPTVSDKQSLLGVCPQDKNIGSNDEIRQNVDLKRAQVNLHETSIKPFVLNEPMDFDESEADSEFISSNHVIDWSELLNGSSSLHMPDITEQELKDMESFNWGKRELSNRKTRIYKRHCKGVYRCVSCGEVQKLKKKCCSCHSDVSHVECMAVIYYKLDGIQVIDLKHDGVHSCRIKPDSKSKSSSRVIETECLPYDINGDVVYRVDIEKDKNPWSVLSDGRKWGPYQKLSGNQCITVYQRKCLSRPACYSDECPFYQRYSERNSAQFEKRSGIKVCRECSEPVTIINCTATKTLSISNEMPKSVMIKHSGHHVCTAIKNFPVPKQEIEEITKSFPNIKPAVVSSSILITKLLDNNSTETLHDVASGMLKQKKIQDTKDKVRKKLYPHGTSIDAVEALKATLLRDDKDKYYIAYVKKDPMCVLTTSKEKLKIACELSGIGQEMWTTIAPYAHIDFHPSRVCGMTVLGVQCYHPNLKQTVCLFKYYAEHEVSSVVEDALCAFNETLNEYSSGACPSFNPAGWMSDEAGSILKALETVYGVQIHTKLVTCQAHYAMAVQRMQRFLGSSAGNDFAKEAYSLEKSLTAAQYNNAKDRLCEFICRQPKSTKLMSWLKWWDCRKSHWAMAFRPTNNAPQNNLSECIHAWEKARGSVDVMLLEAVHDDITSAITLKSKTDGYRQGWYTGGSGKSLLDMVDITGA